LREDLLVAQENKFEQGSEKGGQEEANPDDIEHDRREGK
jgi:hypothetical protein